MFVFAGADVPTLLPLVLQLADRLLSTESSRAVKTIRTIISRFPDHGVVDVFKEYPARDVGVAILALSKLQTASLYYTEEHHFLSKQVNDPELLEKLAHYAVFAKAAYGWKYDLAFRGRIHLGDHQALLKQTGIDEENVIAAHWQSKTHRPVSVPLSWVVHLSWVVYLLCRPNRLTNLLEFATHRT